MRKALFIIFISLVLPNYAFAHVANPVETGVNISAFVGDHTFFLYGYTSPKAKVALEGIGIFDETYSNKEGYFEFSNRFSPLSPREACLTSQDQFGRVSNPVCIPPFPTQYDINIGPVILAPTMSLDKEYYFVGQEVILTGQTLPNTQVNLALYADDKNSFVDNIAQFPRPVEAFSFPELQARSDALGNFSIRLPSNNPEVYRLFAQTDYNNEASGKSNTLHFKILPFWVIIIRFLLALWEIVKSRLIELIILAEVVFLALYFLRRYLHPHNIAKNRAIVRRDNLSLIEA